MMHRKFWNIGTESMLLLQRNMQDLWVSILYIMPMRFFADLKWLMHFHMKLVRFPLAMFVLFGHLTNYMMLRVFT